MKNKWLDRTMFRSPYRYTLVTSQEMFDREMRRLKAPQPYERFVSESAAATIHSFTSSAGVPVAVVGVLPQDDGILVASCIAHEATHLMRYICERIGEDHPSSEFQAYMVQNITYELLTEYKRQTQ